MRGVVSGTLAWIEHPLHSSGTVFDWFAGLVLILILAFFWSTVVGQILE